MDSVKMEPRGRLGQSPNIGRCKFCGLDVLWVDRVPYNTGRTGGDHRTTCVGLRKDYRHKVRDENHERAVERFLNSKMGGKRRKRKGAR